jgi:hypothetical protein
LFEGVCKFRQIVRLVSNKPLHLPAVKTPATTERNNNQPALFGVRGIIDRTDPADDSIEVPSYGRTDNEAKRRQTHRLDEENKINRNV